MRINAGVALTNNIRQTRVGTNSPTTLLNPNPDDIYPGVIVTSPNIGDITGNTQALYVFDTDSRLITVESLLAKRGGVALDAS
jgi:hypothetical protein